MNATEKAVLKDLVVTMRKSTKTSWTQGDIEKWSEWAKKMRTVIQTSCNTIMAMTSVEEDDAKDFELSGDVKDDILP